MWYCSCTNFNCEIMKSDVSFHPWSSLSILNGVHDMLIAFPVNNRDFEQHIIIFRYSQIILSSKRQRWYDTDGTFHLTQVYSFPPLDGNQMWQSIFTIKFHYYLPFLPHVNRIKVNSYVAVKFPARGKMKVYMAMVSIFCANISGTKAISSNRKARSFCAACPRKLMNIITHSMCLQ